MLDHEKIEQKLLKLEFNFIKKSLSCGIVESIMIYLISTVCSGWSLSTCGCNKTLQWIGSPWRYDNFILVFWTGHNFIAAIFPRHWNVGLVSSRLSLNSFGEGASLTLDSDPLSNGVTLKVPYNFIVRSVEIGWWTLVLVVISVDAYTFLDTDCLEGTGIDVFWLHFAVWYSEN